MKPDLPPIAKPKLRGHLHEKAFYLSIGACVLLIAHSSSLIASVASGIYSGGLLTMFGTSALYHRPNWTPNSRAIMKRLDHSAIFLMIAGSTTPVAMLALPDDKSFELLLIIWTVAIFGILQSIFWVNLPKFVKAFFYIGMGALVLPYLKYFSDSIDTFSLTLMIAGGVVYSLGAVCYAAHWPKLNPRVFGYHEVFHALTIVAAICHFVVIYRLLES